MPKKADKSKYHSQDSTKNSVQVSEILQSNSAAYSILQTVNVRLIIVRLVVMRCDFGNEEKPILIQA